MNSIVSRGLHSAGWVFFVGVCALTALPARPQDPYRKPPQAVVDILAAPATPVAVASPSGDQFLLARPVHYPGIAELSEPMLRLAGLRFNPAAFGLHNPPRFDQLVLERVADGQAREIALPPDPHVSLPEWSPNGKHFAFTLTTHNRIELWLADAARGTARAIPGVALSAVLGAPCAWMADSRTMLCRTVPAGRGTLPAEPRVPLGPTIEESFGKAAPVPTFEDLLENKHDEDLFDYYATSQLELVDTLVARTELVGKPAIFATAEPAPDGRHLLVARVHRPYSYIVEVDRFPREVEVWDRAGRVAYRLASLPLSEDVPIGGVPTGPRDYHWRPTDPATLVWVEARDGGDPKKKVPARDHVLWLKVPFTAPPGELAKTEQRFAGLVWGERGDLAIIRDFDRHRLWTRAWLFNPDDPSQAPRLAWSLNIEDRYHSPGQPVMRLLPNGHRAMVQQGDSIFLTGAGASPEGDRPFLDRFDAKKLAAERLFRCDEKSYEEVVALLAPDGARFLTRRETSSDPPNYYVRGAGSDQLRPITHFADPAPQLRQIRKELVKYNRADGVELSMTLYLPPDYKPGERRPAVVWAYPREYTDPGVAGQVSGSPNRFITLTGLSPLVFLLDGYVVLDGPTMPVVGPPETANDTYIPQIVSSAKAAIEKATWLGYIDPDRVGVGGHSYGAFMTANLLAHSGLFRAGIARSGAYNRTLTPFGFQNERRTLWEAPELYFNISPFLFADRIHAPLLLIHGEADNNSGTFPIQSNRMYRAIKGNGGAVRYVQLPDEAHGYAARESIEHMIWEMFRWFDQFVKNAPPSPKPAPEAADKPPAPPL